MSHLPPFPDPIAARQALPQPEDEARARFNELAAIRREIARLQRRESLLLAQAEAAGPRPGWPMQRLGDQAMG